MKNLYLLAFAMVICEPNNGGSVVMAVKTNNHEPDMDLDALMD